MDVYSLVLLALLAVMIFFMFRNSKKRKAEMEAVREKMVPGVEVMTNFGLFGVLVSVDDDTNVAEVETTPGTIVRVHRQTLSRVVEETVPVDADADADAGVAELPGSGSTAVGDETTAADPARRTGKSDTTD